MNDTRLLELSRRWGLWLDWHFLASIYYIHIHMYQTILLAMSWLESMTWHDYFIYLFICRSQLKSELVTVKTLGRKLIVRLSQIRDASSLQTSHGDQRSTSAVKVPIELKILAWLALTSHVSHLVIHTTPLSTSRHDYCIMVLTITW